MKLKEIASKPILLVSLIAFPAALTAKPSYAYLISSPTVSCPYSSTELYFKREEEATWQSSALTLQYGERVIIGATHNGNSIGGSPAVDVKFSISPAATGFPYYATLDQPTTNPSLLPPILPTGAGEYNSNTVYTVTAATIANGKELSDPDLYPGCNASATLEINPCPFTSSSVQLAEENSYPGEWWDYDTGFSPGDGEADRPNTKDIVKGGRYLRLRTHSLEKIYAKVKHRMPDGTVKDTSKDSITNLIPGAALKDRIRIWGPQSGGTFTQRHDAYNTLLNLKLEFTWNTLGNLLKHGQWDFTGDTLDKDDEFFAEAVLLIDDIPVNVPQCQDGGDFFYVDPCTYDSTQAYVRKYESQPWMENLEMEVGESFQVGAFHEQPEAATTPRAHPPYAPDYLSDEWDDVGEVWENFASLDVFGPYGFQLSSNQWGGMTKPPIRNGEFTDLKLSGGEMGAPGEYQFRVFTYYDWQEGKGGKGILSEYCADKTPINVGIRQCPQPPPAKGKVDCCAPEIESENITQRFLGWLGSIASFFLKVGVRDLKAPFSLTELADALHSKVIDGQLVSYGTRQLLSRPDEAKSEEEVIEERKEPARWSIGLKGGETEINEITYGTILNTRAAKEGVAAVAAKLSRPSSGAYLGAQTEKEEKVLGAVSDTICTDVVEEPLKGDLCFTEREGQSASGPAIRAILEGILSGAAKGGLVFSTDYLDYLGRFLAGLDTSASGGKATEEDYYNSGGLIKVFARPGEPSQDYENYHSGKGEGDFVVGFKPPEGWPIPGFKIDLGSKKEELKYRYEGSGWEAFKRIQENLERP